jgi:hypothetical protein
MPSPNVTWGAPKRPNYVSRIHLDYAISYFGAPVQTAAAVLVLSWRCRGAHWPSGARLVLRVNRSYDYAFSSKSLAGKSKRPLVPPRDSLDHGASGSRPGRLQERATDRSSRIEIHWITGLGNSPRTAPDRLAACAITRDPHAISWLEEK